ncbi:MAG: hypothetical protein ACKOE6_17085 [Flammeovirgaceae bacterium]
MRWPLSILFFAVLNSNVAQHAHSQDRPATHGMVIFGNAKIYAYHLPMFHSPHHYQIILELEFDEATRKKWRIDQKQNPQHITYTIEPEKFVLPEMVANPKPFKVNLYRGHLERGGTMIAEKSTATIRQVVYFRQLETTSAKSASANYILFGNASEQFAVHQISHPPDFDQIIRVIAPHSNTFQLATLASTNAPMGISGNSLQALLEGKKAQVNLLHQVYLEFDDLQD